MTKIRLHASYELVDPEATDVPDVAEWGYTDPRNPWGGFRDECPPGTIGEAFTAWYGENAQIVEFDTVEEAAAFAQDFPGAVSDLWPCDESTTSDGMVMTVALSVAVDTPDDVAQQVYAMAKRLQDEEDERLQALIARR